MSRRGESDTFNISSADIYDVMHSVFGASANTITGYAEIDSSARNVPYTGVPQSAYDVLQNSDRSSANEMYSGNNNHPPSLANDERNSSSLLQERLLNILDAYNTSDSSALEAALREFRPPVPSSSQSAPRQDWNQEYSQSHQLKELANLDRLNTNQTLCDSPEASSDAESSKLFNDLKMKIDEEDEFLYGDSNSLPEIPKSVRDYPEENKKVILGTGWSDDEEDDNDITDDNSAEGKSISARTIWDARNRGEITQSDVSVLLDKLSSIKRDEKALPKIPMEQFFGAVKEPFVASPRRSEESYQGMSPGVSSPFKTEKQSKYHAAAQILKNRILEQTRLVNESSSNESVSEIAQFHREISETDNKITGESSKILVSNKRDSETDKIPVIQQKHIPEAFVQKDIERFKNYLKDLTGESIHHLDVELEQESEHFRYEPDRKVSPPRHYSPHEIIRHDYRRKPSPHIRPPNSDNERKTLESRNRSKSHEKSPGRYRPRMRSPGSHRSKRSRSPGSQRSKRSRSPGSQRSKRSRSPGSQRSKRSRSPGSQRSKRSRSPRSFRTKRSRSPAYSRSRRSRSPPSRRSRERSRSPRRRQRSRSPKRRQRSRSPRSYRSRERSKSPRRRKSQERNTIARGKSDDKTKKSLSSSQKKPDEKKKSRVDSRSSSSSSNSSSDSGSSSSSDSSIESSSKRERDNRKKELSEKKPVPKNDTKNEITEGSTKSVDVVNVKNTVDATPPPADLAKKISDILSLCPPRDTPHWVPFVEGIKQLQNRLQPSVGKETIFHPKRPQSTHCNTLQAGPPASALFGHPSSTPYPQSSQVDPQQTLGVPNVINVKPQSQSPNFANDNLYSVQMNAFKIKKPTLRQIEVSNDFSGWNKEDSSNKFEKKIQEEEKVKEREFKKTQEEEKVKEREIKKVQEIKEKKHMTGGHSKSDSAAESNYKKNKNWYIGTYKRLELDRQLKQERTRNTANDGAEMLKIMNKAFGKKIYGSEQMIHAKCKDLFKVSRDVFDITMKERKRAEENLKKFISEIPPEFEQDVLGVKVDLSEEEATDEVYTCFDLGDHTCILCNGKFTCLANMMAHIHCERHIKQVDACDNSWKAFFTKDKNKMDVVNKKKSDKVQAVQGTEFMKPLIGFFCDLCKETFLDKVGAEEHLKSHTHFVNFKSFIKQNPLYEQKYLLKKYVQMNMLAKIKRQKEMERQKRKEEKKKKEEEEANEKAKAVIRKEKSMEIKFNELDDTEVVSVSNVQSSASIKVNLSSPGEKSQKEPEAKSPAKFAYIGKAPNYRKSPDKTARTMRPIPWYKKESYKKSDDGREGKSSETKEKPLNSERETFPSHDANVGNLSQSKDYEEKQKHKVLHDSSASKKDSGRYSPSDIFNEKSSKSQSGRCESNTSRKDKDANRYSPSDIFSQKLPNSASSASSAHQDIPLPKEKPSKVEESLPMDIDNSQDTSFKPNLPLSKEAKDWALGIHNNTQSSLGDGKNVNRDSSQNLADFSVPPPSIVPAPYGTNRPPMSDPKQWNTLYPANQGNTQSVGLYSYQQNNNPSMFVYSNTYNIQSVSPFTSVPPPSLRNHPTGTYPNPSNIPYVPPQQQQYYSPTNMSPMQAFSNTNRFSVPPPLPGSPHAYAPTFNSPPPSYPIQSNVPSLPAAPQTFVPHSSVGNPLLTKSTAVNPNPIIQTHPAVKVIQTTSVNPNPIIQTNPAVKVIQTTSVNPNPIIQTNPAVKVIQTTSVNPNPIILTHPPVKYSQTTSVSPIQSESPSFTNQNTVSKPNLIEIVRAKYKVSCNKDANVVESGTESVKVKETPENVPVSSTSQTSSDDVKNSKKNISCINYQYYLFLNSKKKETCENLPVSSTSEVTHTRGSLGDGENVKKDSSQNHKEIIPSNLEELRNKDEKTNVAKQLPDKLSEVPSKSENEDNEMSVETVKCLEGENAKTSKWDVREMTVKSQIGSAMEDEKSKKPCTSEEGLLDDLVNKVSASEDKKNKVEESDAKSVKEKEVAENVPASSTSGVTDIKTGLVDGENTEGGSSPNNEIQTISVIFNNCEYEYISGNGKNRKRRKQNVGKKTVKSQIESITVDISDDAELKNPCTSDEGLPCDLINKDSESDSKSVKEKEGTDNVPVSSTSEMTDIQTSLDSGKNFKEDSSQNHIKIISNLEELGNKDEKNKIEKSYTKSLEVREISENVPGSSTSETFKDTSQNLTKITSDLGESSKDEKNKIVESDTDSVKEKEISQNVPVSFISEVTDIKTGLDEGENVKKDDSSQNHTKIVPNLGESDSKDGKNNVVQVSEKLSTKSENLDDIEDNEISIIAVKRLKGKNRETKKQNVRNDSVKLVVSVLEDISDDETFKKPRTSDECMPDDSTNKTDEDSKIDENQSKISDPSECLKNLTDSIKSSDKESSLGDCVKDIKGSEMGDSASISEDCEIIYDEPAQVNQKTKPKVTRKRKLVKQRIQPSRKQTSAGSNNAGAECENTGKKVKENQEENQVLSSNLQNVMDVREEYNKVSGEEKIKMSMAVSKINKELGHNSNEEDKTSLQLSEKQGSAVDSENIQKETENVAPQASTEPEIVKENFEEKSLLTATNSCTSVKDNFVEKSLFTTRNSCTSDNEKSEVMEVDGVEETDSSKNVSESFNLPSTAVGKEEISENISSPESCDEVLPDVQTETIVLVTEETSEIINPIKGVRKTRKRGRRRKRF